MPIKTARWTTPREPDDGLRVLVCRYRPRGLAKAKETWDVWMRELGPSPDLFAAFKGKGQTPISLTEYFRRYTDEMQGPEPRRRIEELAGRLARGETVTLLCSRDCFIAEACHRTVLARLIEGSVPEAAESTRE